MLTGQSDGSRPIPDPGVLGFGLAVGELPGMRGHAALLRDLQQRVCLKKTQEGPVWLSYSSILEGGLPAPVCPSVGITSKTPGSQANVKMGGEVLSCQAWSREVMGPLLQWSEGWAVFLGRISTLDLDVGPSFP